MARVPRASRASAGWSYFISRNNKHAAKRFDRWVSYDVLMCISKTDGAEWEC